MSPPEPPNNSSSASSTDRRIAIEHAAGLLGIDRLPGPDPTADPATDLERTVQSVINDLGLGTREPTATINDRCQLLIELLDIAISPIDDRWPQRIVTAACDLADADGVDDMEEIRAFVASFVQRSLDTRPRRRNRHYRSAVEWADEVGYLFGSLHAERVSLQAYRESLATDPAHALIRLERAVFHRSARALPRDALLPRWRLAAADLCAQLGRHGDAVAYFSQAWPALDATGDPASERTIDAFRAAGRSARLAGDLEAWSRFALEAVRRLHIALERATRSDGGAPSSLMATAAEAELGLGAALAAVGNIAAALRWALYVASADPSVVTPGSHLWVSARSDAARYHHALGHPRSAAEILNSALDQLRPLLGSNHAAVVELDRQLRGL